MHDTQHFVLFVKGHPYVSQWQSEDISSYSFRQSESCFITLCRRQSSAKRCIWESIFVSMTSTKSKERSKDCPLWYSLWNDTSSDEILSNTTFWEGLVKEHLIQPRHCLLYQSAPVSVRTSHLIPICSSLSKGLWCRTLSNGLLYSVLIVRRLCDLFWLVNFKYLYLKSSEMSNGWLSALYLTLTWSRKQPISFHKNQWRKSTSKILFSRKIFTPLNFESGYGPVLGHVGQQVPHPRGPTHIF